MSGARGCRSRRLVVSSWRGPCRPAMDTADAALPHSCSCWLRCAARAEPVHAHYEAYAAGLNVMHDGCRVRLSGPALPGATWTIRTTGAFGVLFNGQQDHDASRAVRRAARAAPARTTAPACCAGEPRVTLIDYRDGQPSIGQLVPPNEAEREPVPAELQRGTIDTLSAMAQLIDQVDQTGRCDGARHDLRRPAPGRLGARTVGHETAAAERPVELRRACAALRRSRAGSWPASSVDEDRASGSSGRSTAAPGSPPSAGRAADPGPDQLPHPLVRRRDDVAGGAEALAQQARSIAARRRRSVSAAVGAAAPPASWRAVAPERRRCRAARRPARPARRCGGRRP